MMYLNSHLLFSHKYTLSLKLIQNVRSVISLRALVLRMVKTIFLPPSFKRQNLKTLFLLGFLRLILKSFQSTHHPEINPADSLSKPPFRPFWHLHVTSNQSDETSDQNAWQQTVNVPQNSFRYKSGMCSHVTGNLPGSGLSHCPKSCQNCFL